MVCEKSCLDVRSHRVRNSRAEHGQLGSERPVMEDLCESFSVPTSVYV